GCAITLTMNENTRIRGHPTGPPINLRTIHATSSVLMTTDTTMSTVSTCPPYGRGRGGDGPTRIGAVAASLLVAGTTSDAGKSIVTTALCRAFARRGLKVAPFKAQNMSNSSMVVCDPAGPGVTAEIGRAQWIQALAARATPEPAMNPVLLKPGGDRRSHVVVMGQPAGTVSSRDFVDGRAHLADAAFAAYDDLASRHDLVICEGAGSPTEINLRG